MSSVMKMDPPSSTPAVKKPPDSREHNAATPRPRREPTFIQVFTLVLWLVFLVVGLLGLWLETGLIPKTQPPALEAPLPPVQAELINVDMTQEPEPQLADLAPAPADNQMPDVSPALPPELPAVAAPSAAYSFSVAVQGPARIVSGNLAGRATLAPPRRAVVVEKLVFGQGTASRQPKPEYPPAAIAAHQEGTVVVEFSVAPGGRVNNARVFQPSLWPLLNEAAMEVVSEQWTNPAWAPNHLYQVAIRFKLNQR